MSDDIRVHVATAAEAAAAVKGMKSIPSRYTHVGVGLTHAICALAISLDKFADAITPKETP